MDISIQQFERCQAFEVALLHAQSITTGFLSSLGPTILKRLYSRIAQSPGTIIITATNESREVVGFIAGSLSTKTMYRFILLHHGLFFLLILLPRLFNGKIIFKIIETVLYPFRKQKSKEQQIKLKKTNGSLCDDHTQAELLSIAVKSMCRGSKIGKKLTAALEDFFRRNAISQYTVVTFSEDLQSNRFYSSCGFTLSQQFEHHGNLLNRYIKTIE